MYKTNAEANAARPSAEEAARTYYTRVHDAQLCCERAVRHQCVCRLYFTCTEHPTRGGHHGSHS